MQPLKTFQEKLDTSALDYFPIGNKLLEIFNQSRKEKNPYHALTDYQLQAIREILQDIT